MKSPGPCLPCSLRCGLQPDTEALRPSIQKPEDPKETEDFIFNMKVNDLERFRGPHVSQPLLWLCLPMGAQRGFLKLVKNPTMNVERINGCVFF